jgi:acyl-CoA thioesterase-1
MKTLFLEKTLGALLVLALFTVANAHAESILITAIGDSNIAGKGVSSSDAYPAKLERALRAKGYDVRVLNNGITGDTTKGVLSRLSSAAPKGTQVAIVWVGINDLRAGASPGAVEADR